MTANLCLTGGHVLTPHNDFEIADVAIADGTIVDSPVANSLTIDCRGYHVLPAIIDVHGDAFELELHPRPRIDISFPIAMGSVDRQLLSNGIATAYHGLTISWEPGARSLAAGREFMAGLQTLRPSLKADHRVQLRWGNLCPRRHWRRCALARPAADPGRCLQRPHDHDTRR